MVTPGFFFKKLEIRGKRKATASITFAKSLTVVSGASDTGKSYLVQCLNFMTGATTPPDAIDEAKGYETLWLEIETWAGATFSLERSLKGGDFNLYPCELTEVPEHESEILKAKNRTKKHQTVSDFLLKLCDLDGVKLLSKKKDGSKWTLKFRAIAHLCIVDEERIYTKRSPVHGSHIVLQKTHEESLFRFLLTGVDDSSIITTKVSKTTNTSFEAKVEMIEEIIEATESDLDELTDAPDEVMTQLSNLENALEEATTAVALNREDLREKESQRNSLWNTIERNTGRLDVLTRLISRFELLNEYYSTDIKRLRSMAEAGQYLTKLPQVECPICGTEDAWGSDDDLELMSVASTRELQRIELLKDDLASTVEDLSSEAVVVDRATKRAKRSYRRIGEQIENQLAGSDQILKAELDELLENQRRLERAGAVIQQLERLQEQLATLNSTDDLDDPPTKTEKPSQGAKTSETEAFCKVVEKLLKEWEYPNGGRVTFSEGTQDLVINGKDRSNHGKGIRALTHAAFTVSLLRFCRKVKRPWTGFAVLDSPLVAYRPPKKKRKEEEEVKKAFEVAGVKESFYRSLAKKQKNQQIIVFENEDPPEEVREDISFVFFAGEDGSGDRHGFFPSA